MAVNRLLIQQFSFWLPNRLKAELQTLRGAVIRCSEFRLQPVRAATTAKMRTAASDPELSEIMKERTGSEFELQLVRTT